jgi:hypothetical protein
VGFATIRFRRALKGRRALPPFQGGDRNWLLSPGALPRAVHLRAVGARPWPFVELVKYESAIYEMTWASENERER